MYYALPDELDTPPRPGAIMEDDHTSGGRNTYHSPMMHTSQPDEDVIDGPAMDTRHDEEDDEDEDDEEEYDNEDDEEDGDETEAATTSPGGSVRGGGGAGAGGDAGGAATTGGNAAGAAGGGQAPVMIVPAVPNLDSLYGLREMGRDALCWRLSSAKPGNGVEQIRDHSTETYWQSDGTSQPHWIQVHFARRVAISHVCLYLDYNLDESYTPRRVTVQVGMTSQDLQPAILPRPTVVELHEPVGWCIIPLSSPPDTLDEYDRLADSFAEQNRVSDTHEGDDSGGGGVFAAALMEEDGSGSAGGTNPSSSSNSGGANNNGSSRTSRRSGGNRSRRQKRNNQPLEEDATAKQEGLVKAHLIQISILAQHQNGRDTHVRQVQLYGPRMTATTAPQAKALVERNMFPTRSSRYQFHGEDEFCTVAMSQYSTIR